MDCEIEQKIENKKKFGQPLVQQKIKVVQWSKAT